MRLLPLLLVLGGCAVTSSAADNGQDLARALEGRTAGPPQQCVDASSPGNSLVALERRTLTIRDGRTLWVNRLAPGCPGFHSTETLIVEVHEGRYCRNDRVRSVPAGGGIPGAACLLGEFVPYRK